MPSYRLSVLLLIAASLLSGALAAPSMSSAEETFASSEYYSSSSSESDWMTVTPPPPAVQLDFVYHNYPALTTFLHNVSTHYPSLAKLYSIGKSVQNRQLWVLAVSSTPERHVAGKPEVKYVGNIHGNEPVSKEILLHLILYLVSRYGHDPVVTTLLDRTRIHFLPSMNPDGFEISNEGVCGKDRGRKNYKGFDLNRNFPDFFKRNDLATQPETKAIMGWMSTVPFILSAGLHGGALVASYPYENHDKPIHVGPEEHASPDDDVFRHLATVYASNHASMHRGLPCDFKDKSFKNGIVNGAQWYAVTGGMQDYNYIFHGTMEITLEVSCCKHPKASALRQHWLDNQKALLLYLFEALRGVKGFVTDEETSQPLQGVQLRVKDRGEREFNTTSGGEFWRILLDGEYFLQATIEGYETVEVPFVVKGDDATVLNVTMRRLAVSSTTPFGSVTVVEEMVTSSSTGHPNKASVAGAGIDYSSTSTATVPHPITTSPPTDDYHSGDGDIFGTNPSGDVSTPLLLNNDNELSSFDEDVPGYNADVEPQLEEEPAVLNEIVQGPVMGAVASGSAQSLTGLITGGGHLAHLCFLVLTTCMFMMNPSFV